MAPTLEIIKRGGGSILGTTGTISSLMTRELDQISSPSHKQVSSRSKPRTVPISVDYGSTTPKRLQPRKSLDEASSSESMSHRSPGVAQKTKTNVRHTHKVPMLRSDSFAVDRSPIREKHDKNISNIVELVDIKLSKPR
ncbi:hypothetical protein L6164_028486 [Bauhinia variegata]|uniref:Uncharacterized protein n=1 Tax=Bauhinia variegata TaxID=167791 RepID=A0ACB9L630_BAUVA|nr:hypothetical protein L6164_028486 [Bauhinia variegata]